MQYTLPNKIVLDDEGGWVKGLQHHAERKGLSNVRVFLATHPNGKQYYVITEKGEAIFESTSAEAISCHLDIMYLQRDLKRD